MASQLFDGMLTMADIHPPRTTFAPLTTREGLKWVYDDPTRLDPLTGNTVGIMGTMPLICHEATATEEIQSFFRLAGLESSALLTYSTERDAIDLSLEQVAQGDKLACFFSPPAALARDANLLVPLQLYNRLCNKALISDYVDKQFLASRQFYPAGNLPGLAGFPGRAVVLKACMNAPNGTGFLVRFCPDESAWQTALSWYTEREEQMDGLVVEDEVDVVHCWCVGVSILDEVITYLGAAVQKFVGPGKQSGNIIAPEMNPPNQVKEIAMAIANRARKEGYLGVAGFDIGVDRQGELYVFDLNFRLNGCTQQILMHDGMTRNSEKTCSEIFAFEFDYSFSEALDKLAFFVEQEQFAPTRLFDSNTYRNTYPDRDYTSRINGIIMAESVEGLRETESQIMKALNRH